MQIRDWVSLMSRNGQVCTAYMRKLGAVETKEDMFRVLCDANGGAWLFELAAKDLRLLPIEQFMKEFDEYINGKRVMQYPKGYSGKFYCRHDGEIVADATLVYVLDCPDAKITVPKNKYPSVILSPHSHATIAMEPGARLNIETYGDASVKSIAGDMSRVRVKNNV